MNGDTTPRLQSGTIRPGSGNCRFFNIFGTYTASVYLTPIFGGFLADRLLGRRRTVLLGALTMAAGTAAGGWRIIRTMGLRVVQLRPIHGFAAETAGTAEYQGSREVLEAASERLIDDRHPVVRRAVHRGDDGRQYARVRARTRSRTRTPAPAWRGRRTRRRCSASRLPRRSRGRRAKGRRRSRDCVLNLWRDPRRTCACRVAWRPRRFW